MPGGGQLHEGHQKNLKSSPDGDQGSNINLDSQTEDKRVLQDTPDLIIKDIKKWL